jgi:lysozyme family protein
MKESFEQSLKFVLADEGKFSDIPEDRGGPTNQGITLKTLKEYHAHFDYGDFDHDGDVDIEDIRLLDTPEEAAPIYRRWFWDAVQGDALPAGVDYIIFDSAVNHGPINAGRFLQRASNRQRGNLVTDGIIGPATIQRVQGHDRQELITDILRERDIFYRKIIARDPSQEKFFRGWMNRLARISVNVRAFEA